MTAGSGVDAVFPKSHTRAGVYADNTAVKGLGTLVANLAATLVVWFMVRGNGVLEVNLKIFMFDADGADCTNKS